MKRFIHRHQPPSSLRNSLLAGLGAAVAVGLLALVTDHTTLFLLMAPFGASAVLLFAAPTAHLSQPANLIGGHVLAATIGLLSFSLLSPGYAASACSVGLAVAAMVALRVVHPPAGATALVAATAKGWSFLLFPVLSGSILLVLMAWLYHRSFGTTYPLHPK